MCGTKESDAMDLRTGVFKLKSARAIAKLRGALGRSP
jgi:hypothetical protein